MSKIELDNISGGYDLSKINVNFQKIEDALNNLVLYRNNTSGEDNALTTDVDVNGVVVYNIPTPTLASQVVPLSYINQLFIDAANTIQWKNVWMTGTLYKINNGVSYNGSSYICIFEHTSSTFNTDLSNNKWALLAEAGADGVGSGDMVAANNLSELTSATNARSNLGLGSMALEAATNYVPTSGIGSTVEAYDADHMFRDVETDITGAMTHTVTTLTDAANIDWNLDVQQNATVTLAGNRIMNAPSNAKAGRYVALRIVQDGSGGKTITWNAAYKNMTGVVLSTAANAVDFILFRCINTTNLSRVSFVANCEA